MPLEFPIIYLLTTRLDADELHKLEEQIPSLTYDIDEAEVVLGKVSRKQRAKFELRHRKLPTEDVSDDDGAAPTSDDKIGRGRTVKVVKLSWFTDSVKRGAVRPIDDYLVYEGRKIERRQPPSQPPQPPPTTPAQGLFNRAVAERETAPLSVFPAHSRGSPRRTGGSHGRPVKRPPVLHQTTTEHDIVPHLPPIPTDLHTMYSCQRPTPLNPPNLPFILELKKIRKIRTIVGDEIGVRAYSSSIAALSAYPYTLSSPQEVARLPGCGVRTGDLFREFKEYGNVQDVRDAESDPKLSVLSVFYDIWGVAGTTAHEFYNKGWRDLDDLIEHGWRSLSRVQQIGVKYYDELRLGIPRREAREIGAAILSQANRIRDGFQMAIVGGYRRGKEEVGDVDVVLSHPDEDATYGFAEKIVGQLEEAGYVTHTLALSAQNTEREQAPATRKGGVGSGFDTLDKALVVWQDLPGRTHGRLEDEKEMGNGKETEKHRNPNPHRRVDIIVSPWKTVGCAVLGWTGGTTFQRDLRRYCKNELSLRFDSSGIRSRADGSWVDLESGPDGPAPDIETAERRVFAGLGLEWRPPEERCTG